MNNTQALLQRVASTLDQVFNLDRSKPKNGFVLLVFPFDQPEGTRVNYVSNTSQSDIIAALKEVIARFEGRAHDAPKARQ